MRVFQRTVLLGGAVILDKIVSVVAATTTMTTTDARIRRQRRDRRVGAAGPRLGRGLGGIVEGCGVGGSSECVGGSTGWTTGGEDSGIMSPSARRSSSNADW